MLATQPVSYIQLSADGVVKSMPGELYGIVVLASGTGILRVFDNASAASGTEIYNSVTALTAGQVVHFGGLGIRAKNGLYLDLVSGTATVNVLFV